MLSPLRFLPRSWKTDVVILRGGGRDPKGNPLPVVEIPATGCLVGARSSAEPVDRSEVTDGKAVLYREFEKDDIVFLHSDRVRVPAGSRMAGDWSVDGRPGEWPFGWEVGLVRE